MFQNVPKNFIDFNMPEFSSFLNCEFFRMLNKIQDFFTEFYKLPTFFQNISGTSKVLEKCSKCFKIFQNILEICTDFEMF